MTINWTEFATKNFWFNIDRVQIHQTDRIILYAGAVAVIFGLLFVGYRLMTKNKFLKRVAARLSTLFITIGICEMIWYGLRIQYVDPLGTKFVAALIAVIGLIWLYFPVKYLLRRYKVDMAEAQRQIQKEKYLNR